MAVCPPIEGAFFCSVRTFSTEQLKAQCVRLQYFLSSIVTQNDCFRVWNERERKQQPIILLYSIVSTARAHLNQIQSLLLAFLEHLIGTHWVSKPHVRLVTSTK